MGQRLVITLKKEGKDLAAIYYHWGAYTYSALLHTKEMIDCIYNHNDETDEQMLLRLIKFIEEEGGGISGQESEHDYIQALYPNEIFKTDNYSRNNGLIALSPDGISRLQGWSEGDVDILLDDDAVGFYVYGGYESLEEYLEERKSWDDELDESEFENIPRLSYNFEYFDVNDINPIIAEFDGVKNSPVIQYGSEIYELIE